MKYDQHRLSWQLERNRLNDQGLIDWLDMPLAHTIPPMTIGDIERRIVWAMQEPKLVRYCPVDHIPVASSIQLEQPESCSTVGVGGLKIKRSQ